MATEAAPAASAAPATSDEGMQLQACPPSVNPETYSAQLDTKVNRLVSLMSGLNPPPVQVFRSEPSHYRMRAEFRVWHEARTWQAGGDAWYSMFEKDAAGGKPRAYRVDEYPVGSRLLNSLMTAVRLEFVGNEALGSRLFQVNFHTTLSGEAMVTLLYHRKLDDVWREAAVAMRQRLRKALSSECSELHVIGRSRGQRIDLDANTVVERLRVAGREYAYKQVEGSFSQPNAGVCRHMLEWAVDATRGSSGDLLELYCGNGNFTVPLAANFRQVVATEVSKASVEAARDNLVTNSVSNAFIARMSSEEFTEAWRTKAQKNRLKGLDWEALDLQTVLVDPPRAGLDAATLQLLAGFQRVVYISCNPETLVANLRDLGPSHRIERLAAFDQFPFTYHLECGVLLVKQGSVVDGVGGHDAPGVAADGAAAADVPQEAQ